MDDIKKLKSAMPKRYGSIRRLKIERNTGVTLRLLRTEMPESGDWFVQHAKHWVNKKPLTCPVTSSEAIGGDPKGECPICDLVGELETHKDENIAKRARRYSATLQWTMWAVVYDKENEHGSITEYDLEDQLNPYVFEVYQSGMDTILDLISRHGRKRNCPEDNIFDLYEGVTYYVENHKGKGLRFNVADMGEPIFDLKGEKLEKAIDKLYSKIELPKDYFKLTPLKVLDEEAQKLEEFIFSSPDTESGGTRRGRGHHYSDDEVDDNEDGDFSPHGGRSRSRSRSRGSDEEEDDAPSRRGGRGARSRDEDEEEPRSRRGDDEDEDRGRGRGRRDRGSSREAREARESIDKDENVPEETNDPAPSRAMDDEPPEVERDSPPAKESSRPRRGAVGDRLRSRLGD